MQNLHVSGGGNDKAVGVAVNDVQLDGDAGDDELTAEADVTATADGGSGGDTVTCGTGVDVVRYDATDSVAGDCEVLLQD